MSFIQFSEIPSMHAVSTLSHRCFHAAYLPWIHGKQIAIIVWMITMAAAAPAQIIDRGSFFAPGQSITHISPSYARTAISPERNLRYGFNGFGLTHSQMKIATYEPDSKLMASRQKVAGITMVTLGGAMQIGGLIVLVDGANHVNPDNSQGETEMLLGMVMFAGGTAVAVPGVFLWVKGAQKYKRALASQSVRLNFSPMPSLRYRF
jgi:hypothetical protein